MLGVRCVHCGDHGPSSHTLSPWSALLSPGHAVAFLKPIVPRELSSPCSSEKGPLSGFPHGFRQPHGVLSQDQAPPPPLAAARRAVRLLSLQVELVHPVVDGHVLSALLAVVTRRSEVIDGVSCPKAPTRALGRTARMEPGWRILWKRPRISALIGASASEAFPRRVDIASFRLVMSLLKSIAHLLTIEIASAVRASACASWRLWNSGDLGESEYDIIAMATPASNSPAGTLLGLFSCSETSRNNVRSVRFRWDSTPASPR